MKGPGSQQPRTSRDMLLAAECHTAFATVPCLHVNLRCVKAAHLCRQPLATPFLSMRDAIRFIATCSICIPYSCQPTQLKATVLQHKHPPENLASLKGEVLCTRRCTLPNCESSPSLCHSLSCALLPPEQTHRTSQPSANLPSSSTTCTEAESLSSSCTPSTKLLKNA